MFQAGDLAAWTGGSWTRPPPAVATIRHGSAECGPGALFVAIRGERHDGHAFVADAFARGAAAAMVEPAFVESGAASGPLLVVDDTRRALWNLARGHRARLKARVIGVTGSVGKTTVKEWIATVLATAGPVARTRGNFNNDLGLSLSLLDADPAAPWGVFEVGMNHPGELAPLCGLLRPHWAVMTRIAPVHLEFFASEEAIAREKAVLPASTPEDGTVFFAVDEPWSGILRAAAPGRIVTLALECPAEIRGFRDAADPRRLRVEGPDGFRVDCRLPMAGEPALRNALRAAAVGCAAGLDGAAVSGALETVRPPPMRGGEQSIGGVAWINDAYNSSPVSLAAALDTFTSHAAARKWIVLGGMWELGERSDALHREAGRHASGGSWAGLITVGARAATMADGAAEAGWPADRLWRCDDAAGAVDVLRDRLSPGDAVLLKGSRGERMEQVMALWTDARRPAAAPTTD